MNGGCLWVRVETLDAESSCTHHHERVSTCSTPTLISPAVSKAPGLVEAGLEASGLHLGEGRAVGKDYGTRVWSAGWRTCRQIGVRRWCWCGWRVMVAANVVICGATI